MHSQKSLKVLCIGSEDLNNSLNEVKEFLNFDLILAKIDSVKKPLTDYDTVLIDELILDHPKIKLFLKDTRILKLLVSSSNKKKIPFYEEKITRPFAINDLNNKIIDLNSKKSFLKNSTIQIKKYILDKNEKKLKKDRRFIDLTEKEIQLLELLFKQKKPILKKNILEIVWKYSSSADTHTVETHIYRLRKKVQQKFSDDTLIKNTKTGYSI